jgi:hypothetical protein
MIPHSDDLPDKMGRVAAWDAEPVIDARPKPKNPRPVLSKRWRKTKWQIREDARQLLREHMTIKAIALHLELTGRWPRYKKGRKPPKFKLLTLCYNLHIHSVDCTKDHELCYTDKPRDPKVASAIDANAKMLPPRSTG